MSEHEVVLTVWDSMVSIVALMYAVAMIFVLWKEKDRMVIAFSKRPRWNIVALTLFPPVWIWMVLVAKDD